MIELLHNGIMDQIGPNKKIQIEREIIAMITSSLESKTLASDQLHLIANYIKERLPVVTTHTDLIAFFEGLAASWPIFASLGNAEMGKAIEEHRKEVIISTSEMVKEGHMDQALANMKGAASSSIK